jgi:hypothetical protein
VAAATGDRSSGWASDLGGYADEAVRGSVVGLGGEIGPGAVGAGWTGAGALGGAWVGTGFAGPA